MTTRRHVMLGTAGLLAAPALLRPALAAPAIAAAAPDFTGTDTNGASVTLAGLRGKVVVLEWWNHQCPFVNKHYSSSNMQSLQKEAATRGVVWISVQSSAEGEQGFVAPAEANTLMKEKGAAPAHVLIDTPGRIGSAYEAKVTPHMFVIGKDGTLQYMGGIDSIASTRVDDIQRATPYAREAIIAVSEGRTPANAVTRPYGCVIKYGA